MIIYLPTARQYDCGELVIIEHTNGEYEKTVFVSRVQTVNTDTNEIGLPLPLDPHQDMWDFLYGEATGKPASYGDKAWLSKFKASEYENYMRVDIDSSGGMQMSGA